MPVIMTRPSLRTRRRSIIYDDENVLTEVRGGRRHHRHSGAVAYSRTTYELLAIFISK